MERIKAKSTNAIQAYALVNELQQKFVDKLNKISERFGKNKPYEPTEWFRENGQFGGGVRFMATDESLFNRASVNVSQVQYENEDSKQLASASAISTIIHPKNPLAPSIHIHISWTEMKSGSGYWRIMADLNPSVEYTADTVKFADALKDAAPTQYQEASDQGDRYFNIPALNRHRGVTHFYLENYSTDSFTTDIALARTTGEAAIDVYCEILIEALQSRTSPDKNQLQQQLDYHTLYLFQVLTLDRGTTSGLLVHDQNDIGILASLPAQINRPLLASWSDNVPSPQNLLVDAIVSALPDDNICKVNDETKQSLANCVRKHYQTHPEAINLQASGNTVPPTVDNHKTTNI